MQEQVDKLKDMLEGMGIEHEQRGMLVSFNNGDGECVVFPSTTMRGKLVVRYSRDEWCDTAEQALEACGLIGS